MAMALLLISTEVIDIYLNINLLEALALPRKLLVE
jgi:hypothetical protein